MANGGGFWTAVFALAAFASVLISVAYGKVDNERVKWWLIVLAALILCSPLTLTVWNLVFENTSLFVGPDFTRKRGIRPDDGLAPAFFLSLLNALFVWGGVEIANKKHPSGNRDSKS